MDHCRELRIVEESLAPAASVVEVTRRHNVHPNLLTVWRRQARSGTIVPGPAPRQNDEIHFAAVSVAPELQALTAPSGTCGSIESEFAAGVRVRIMRKGFPSLAYRRSVGLS